MAIDSKAARISAVNPGCPWRGTNIYPAAPGFTDSDRAAAVYLYYNLDYAGNGAAGGTDSYLYFWRRRRGT